MAAGVLDEGKQRAHLSTVVGRHVASTFATAASIALVSMPWRSLFPRRLQYPCRSIIASVPSQFHRLRSSCTVLRGGRSFAR
jgi:hypothetical protein